MKSMFEKAATRVMRARMVQRTTAQALRRYMKDLKDPSLLAYDSVYHDLSLQANLADANLKSATISFESVQAVPPLNN
jgi:hypothetical protein